MKNISLILNIVLLLAVAILFYLHFSQKNNTKNFGAPFSNASSSVGSFRIAYINLDTLNKYITYIKTNKESFENEQKSIGATIQSEYGKLEQQKNEFQKRIANASQQEVEQMQAALYQQQQSIEAKKQSLLEALSEKSSNFMDDIEKKLKEFLAEYNKEKKYSFIFNIGSGFEYMSIKDSTMDITKDVVEGMNKKLNN